MQLLTTVALFAASTAGAALVSRQAPPGPANGPGTAAGIAGLFNNVGGSVKPIKVEDVKPLIRPTAKRIQIRYGPFVLPASKDGGASAGMAHGHGGMAGAAPAKATGQEPMDPNGFPFARALDGGYCTDCTVLAAKMDVVLEDGNRADIADGVYLHHVVTLLTGKSSKEWLSSCPVGPGEQPKPAAPQPANAPKMSSFAGGAVDEFSDYYTSVDGKLQSGYHIPKDGKISMSGEIINYKKTEQKVYVRMTMEYIPGIQGVDTVKSSISVDGCGTIGGGFNKKGVKIGNVKSQDYVVLGTGNIVLQRAHMHDGGTGVSAFLNNKLICASDAQYGSSGASLVVNGKKWETINKVKECTGLVHVKPGDRIRLEGGFDYIKHPLRESNGEEQSNMGFMSLTFVPDA